MSEILSTAIDGDGVVIDITGSGGTPLRIEQEALGLFFDRGFPTTTMREIGLACGITAGALYNHFPSKESILVSIVTKIHVELERRLSEALARTGDDPVARLAELVRAHALFHTRFRKEARVANRELSSLPEPARSQIIAARRRMRGWFEQALSDGARTGVFTVTDPLVDTLAILNMGIAIADWFQPGGRLSAEAVADIHAELAVRAVKGEEA